MKWLAPADPAQKLPDTSRFLTPSGVAYGTDKLGQPVGLFPNEWTLRYFTEKNADVKLHDLPLEQTKS
jgi:peptide chain release factor 3